MTELTTATTNNNDMIALMDSWPSLIDYIQNQLDFSQLNPLKEKNHTFKSIVIIGMGGSGISGDLIAEFYQPYLPIPIIVIKDYAIPPFVDSSSLVIILSYSGNTEETIHGLQDASRNGAMILAISSNGKIEQICKEQHHYFFKVPANYQPRAALPLLLFPALLSLQAIFSDNVPQFDLQKIKQVLKQTQQNISHLKSYLESLTNKIVFIYAARPFHSIAYRFQCQLNENAKTHAAHFPVPEQNHNAIVPFQTHSPFPLAYVFIRHEHEHPRNRLRLDYMIAFLKEKGITPLVFKAPHHNDAFLDALSLLYSLDYLSVFLAIENNQNPMDITAIRGLKQHLKKYEEK